MDKRNKFEGTKITNDELDEMNGSHLRYKIGDCFIDNDHYYMQRENNVLHINEQIINTLHNCSLDEGDFKKISKEDFEKKLKMTIFDMGIYKYTKNDI